MANLCSSILRSDKFTANETSASTFIYFPTSNQITASQVARDEYIKWRKNELWICCNVDTLIESKRT